MERESGALNPCSKIAEEHAEMFYESVRKQSNDIFYISQNTRIPYEQISLIKGHIFYNKHVLSSGIRRFFPDYMMAELWRRLSSKNSSVIQSHDLIMLQHELLEIRYLFDGYSCKESHDKACIMYDYGKAANEYYRRLGYKV